MRMIDRIQTAHIRRIPQLPLAIRNVATMIHEHSTLPNRPRRIASIPHILARRVIERPELIRVIRRATSHDDGSAQRGEVPTRPHEVLVERVHGGVGGRVPAGLVAVAWAVRAAVGVAVVSWVVMTKLDEDDVVGFEDRGDLLEAALYGVGACGAAADGFVDHGDGERVGEVVAESCWLEKEIVLVSSG